MRKTYQKPLLFAERFAMNEHIAQSCGVQTSFGGDCPITVDGLTFFTNENDCSEDAVSMFRFAEFDFDNGDPVKFLIDEINPTCYNSLTDFHQMFTS